MKKRRKLAPMVDESVSVKLSSERKIVLIDQEPLREEAGRAARKKIREVEKLTISLEEFDKTILPAYARWEDEVLGPLMREERALLARIEYLDHLIDQANFAAFASNRDPSDVISEFEKIMNDRKEEQSHRASQPPPEEDEPLPDPDAGRDFSEEEREFRTYVRYNFDEEPDTLGKREYKRLLREFLEWKRMREEQAASVAGKKKDIPARVKELYRVLVRRLHPDTGKHQNDPATRRMWHDLQEAYAAMDVDRLEALLALTDLHESGNSIRSTLFHLRKVAQDMDRTVRELQARFRSAKSTSAWKLWHSKDRAKIEKKLREDIQERIEDARVDIDLLETEIEFLKKTSHKVKKASTESNPAPVPEKKSPPVFGDAPSPSYPPKKPPIYSRDQGTFDF